MGRCLEQRFLSDVANYRRVPWPFDLQTARTLKRGLDLQVGVCVRQVGVRVRQLCALGCPRAVGFSPANDPPYNPPPPSQPCACASQERRAKEKAEREAKIAAEKAARAKKASKAKKKATTEAAAAKPKAKAKATDGEAKAKPSNPYFEAMKKKRAPKDEL